jgi:hypothetical protein
MAWKSQSEEMKMACNEEKNEMKIEKYHVEEIYC